MVEKTSSSTRIGEGVGLTGECDGSLVGEAVGAEVGGLNEKRGGVSKQHMITVFTP